MCISSSSSIVLSWNVGTTTASCIDVLVLLFDDHTNLSAPRLCVVCYLSSFAYRVVQKSEASAYFCFYL